LNPKGSNAPAEPIRRNEAQATPQTQTPEPTPDRQLEQETPQKTIQEDDNPKLDLSSPKATATTFIKMFAAGEQVRINATVVPVDGEWLIDSIMPNLRRD